MARLIFDGLTLERAKVLAEWYEGQGEQNAEFWFEIRDMVAPIADVQAKDWLIVDKENQTVTMKVK